MRREQRLNPTEPTDEPTEGETGMEGCTSTEVAEGTSLEASMLQNDDPTKTVD